MRPLEVTVINHNSLFGPDASDILDPISMTDIQRAIKESLPRLIEGIKGDERNVILTLARMWQTVSKGIDSEVTVFVNHMENSIELLILHKREQFLEMKSQYSQFCCR